MKTVAGLRKTRFKGRLKVDWAFTFAGAATTWCGRRS
jgi:hypothetical protein